MKVVMRNTDFFQANLSNASLKNSDFSNAIFYQATLHNTVFNGTYLHGASFDESDLLGATFNGAKLYGASFRDAINVPIEIKEKLDVQGVYPAIHQYSRQARRTREKQFLLAPQVSSAQNKAL